MIDRSLEKGDPRHGLCVLFGVARAHLVLIQGFRRRRRLDESISGRVGDLETSCPLLGFPFPFSSFCFCFFLFLFSLPSFPSRVPAARCEISMSETVIVHTRPRPSPPFAKQAKTLVPANNTPSERGFTWRRTSQQYVKEKRRSRRWYGENEPWV